MATIDPYSSGKIKSDLYALKKDVEGQLVVVLDGAIENRGLELIKQPSRCLRQYDVHELIITCEEAKPGMQVNDIAYLGFFEVLSGGVIVAGDEFHVDGKCVATLLGFDETHAPNHLNIVLRAEERIPGIERGFELGMKVEFRKNVKK